jgi:hypothetical protein
MGAQANDEHAAHLEAVLADVRSEATEVAMSARDISASVVRVSGE